MRNTEEPHAGASATLADESGPGGRREARAQRVLDAQRRLWRAVRLAYAHELLGLDLTMQQLKVVVLVDAMGGATAGQLARRLGIGPSTITGIVDRLCEQGLTCRADDANDRRVTRIGLSAAGVEVIDRLDRGRRENAARLLGRLSEVDLDLVAAAYGVLADAAEAMAIVTADELAGDLAQE